MKLSTKDINFFKENGYLIKRGILDEVLMAQARERFWDYTPERFSKHKPSSWVGPIRPEEEEKTGTEPNESRGFRLHYRTIGSESWMVCLLAKDPAVWSMAEQMLGVGQLNEPKRIRGIILDPTLWQTSPTANYLPHRCTSVPFRRCRLYRRCSSWWWRFHRLARKPQTILLRIHIPVLQ